ncbi:NucA/NucB deoxyribonuclease domain-containing protein [Solwaraspora sp. WMMB335]|uniref:NucA/NucB deoxyribonuclease domain-containing protein n=1 Tax=Solwaraspora sp. WMMB335 TaxID=3404118 RepID=UPI003B9294E7
MHRRKIGIAGVVLGVVAAVLPVTSAAAVPASGAGAAALPASGVGAGTLPASGAGAGTPTCGDDITQDAARLAAAGRSGPATCLRKNESKDGSGRTGGDGVGLAADICGGSTTKARVTACVVEDGVLLIFLVPSGQVIGTIGYTVSSLTTVDYRSLSWSQSFHYQADYVTGQNNGPAVTGTAIYAEPQCIASCTVTSTSLIGGSALPGRIHSATGYFASPMSGVRWAAQSGFKFWFANSLWVNGTSNELTTTPGAHRCDIALGGYPPGCVYETVRPVLEVPSSRYPDYAYHLRLALNYGLPRVLTRTQSTALREANNWAACPTGPNYPRPDGKQCDEYPFASTYEGASTQPYGRQFFFIDWNTGQGFSCNMPWLQTRTLGDSDGFSACMIPAAQNSLGGSDLGNFYYKSRVLDMDTFEVRVT